MSKHDDADDFSLPWRRRSASAPPESLWLSIAWSLEEPERLGEVACLEEGALLGRGEPLSDEASGKRLGFSQRRPGAASPARWLLDSRISRQQLQFSQLSAEGVRVVSVGRCPLSVNGSPVKSALVKAGDVISLRNALLLLVTRRSSGAIAAPARHAAANFEFGSADAHGLVGESTAAWNLRQSLAFAGQSRQHVLLFGDSGSGKELSARAIHALSPRARRALLSRNAATLPEALVDAELFGNAKNYPNPGMLERSGLIGEADGSSLFLDEVGELSRTAQAHLLRVLDHAGEYQRLGEARARTSDFRLISATNRDVATLKHDFAARFPLRIRLPGLNERLEDVPLLVRAVLRRLADSSPALLDRFFERRGSLVAEPRIEPEVIELLLRREYTTHLRELERLLWTALSTSEDDFLAATPEFVREAAPGQVLDAPEPEREAIEQALAAAQGNVTKAARLLGLRNRYVLYRVLRKLRLE